MKLSIITINLNNKEGFRKTAESVVSQTFTDYEWIVIDGGSSDGSKELIEQYSNHIAYWVSEPDKGIYNAMNKGIRVAKGEYCLFLNSGDYLIDADVFEKVFAIPFDEDVVYGYLKFDRGHHMELGNSPKEITLKIFIEGTIHHSGNAFIRRGAFDRWGLYDENLKIVSDWKWFLQAIGLSTATTRYIDVLLSVFDCTGISETNGILMLQEKQDILQKLVPSRIMLDYKNYAGLEDAMAKQAKQIRSTKSYRIGRAILTPFKFLESIFMYINNKICLVYLYFLRCKFRQPQYEGEERIIVSFTTWIKRINNVPAVVDSILKNTSLPDKIVLNLSLEEFPHREIDLPCVVQQLVCNGIIEIIWNEGNTKAFKKFIPTMIKYPNDVIICIDDDFLYPRNFIKTFMDMHEKYPDEPLSGNDVPVCNVNGHSGCASLVKKKYFGNVIDFLQDSNMIDIGMDDIYYPFCAAFNGYYYRYVGTTFSEILKPYYPIDGLSSEMNDSLNLKMISYVNNVFIKKFHINFRNMRKPIVSIL